MSRTRAVAQLLDAKIKETRKPSPEVQFPTLDFEQVTKQLFGGASFARGRGANTREEFLIRTLAKHTQCRMIEIHFSPPKKENEVSEGGLSLGQIHRFVNRELHLPPSEITTRQNSEIAPPLATGRTSAYPCPRGSLRMNQPVSRRPRLISAGTLAISLAAFAAAVATASTAHSGSVVILGDSLSVTKDIGLGNRLDLELRKAGHRVRTIASCGSSPASYRDDQSTYVTQCGYLERTSSSANDPTKTTEEYLPWEKIKNTPGKPTPKLQKIFSQTQSDLAVIQQGTNLYRLIQGNSPEKGPELVADQVFEFLKSPFFQAKACLWIGPPKLAKYYGENGGMVSVSDAQMQAMNSGIQKGLERARRELSSTSPGKSCRFMDSLPVTEKPLGDGIHHWRSGQTTRWVEEAKKESLALLSGPRLPDVQAF